MQRIPRLANDLANGLLMPSLAWHLHRHWQDLLMSMQMACKCLQMIENTAFHLQVHLQKTPLARGLLRAGARILCLNYFYKPIYRIEIGAFAPKERTGWASVRNA